VPAPQEEEDGGDYQVNMMRCLRENNVDNHTAGWYQSSGEAGWQTQEFVKTFLDFSASIKRCVAVVYDENRVATGALPLRAVVVRDKFAEAFRKGSSAFSFEALQKQGIAFTDMFAEVPVEVTNNPLTVALFSDLAARGALAQVDPASLALSSEPVLARNLAGLTELCDDLIMEQNKVTRYHKAVGSQQVQMEAFRQKRRQENIERRARGEEPLPEEDPTQFKPIDPPSMLDNMLISAQIADYGANVDAFAKQALAKLGVASLI